MFNGHLEPPIADVAKRLDPRLDIDRKSSGDGPCHVDDVGWIVEGDTVLVELILVMNLDGPVGSAHDVEVEIPADATPGTYSYVIYVHTAGNYAECNSHPLMIIKGP